ncbi:MAG: hypothetical protein P4L74_02305 [Candidatus Doudnabacteria bacterium]|nr:hypothetical protein [Candidatus Doudnabacteria bacterium]
MRYLHGSDLKERWQKMPLEAQLGNIGSEFGRALNWKQKNQPVYFQKAYDRMLELLDFTISDPRWHNHRLKELCRLRENACLELSDQPQNPAGLNKYFLQFATLARSKR